MTTMFTPDQAPCPTRVRTRGRGRSIASGKEMPSDDFVRLVAVFSPGPRVMDVHMLAPEGCVAQSVPEPAARSRLCTVLSRWNSGTGVPPSGSHHTAVGYPPRGGYASSRDPASRSTTRWTAARRRRSPLATSPPWR